jgi:ABC-type lipoprotein release transport system permease subunit
MGKLSIAKLWMIAYRDLGRNKRRSILTIVAVGLGLGLLITIAGLVAGEIGGALDNSIRLRTGHVQVRAASYEEEKVSLEWEDLLDDPQGLTAQVQALGEARTATPMLWATGILGTRQESVGVQVVGIDPLSEAQAPFREGLTAGQFLDPDDRDGILIGQRLADSLGLTVGDQVSLLVSTADQQPDEAVFTIRGVFWTGVPSYDETMILMPLSKAQAFTRAGDRASTILILLDNREASVAVAGKLMEPGHQVLTWRDMNQLLLTSTEMAAGYMNLINLIVLAVVAVFIANTLLMSVFERTREMGILAALGMKGRQILAMFLLEAATLGLAGIALGLILGGLGVTYLATVGLHVGDVGATGIAIGETIYARFELQETISLSMTSLVITLLAALYPAWFAARMEPIDALRAL